MAKNNVNFLKFSIKSPLSSEYSKMSDEPMMISQTQNSNFFTRHLHNRKHNSSLQTPKVKMALGLSKRNTDHKIVTAKNVSAQNSPEISRLQLYPDPKILAFSRQIELEYATPKVFKTVLSPLEHEKFSRK